MARLTGAALSRRLAFVLRHDPGSIGLTLDVSGWVTLEDLVAALTMRGADVSVEDIGQVLTSGGKTRFEALDGRIRAHQGHSIGVDLGLNPLTPPCPLFHGTSAEALDAVMAQGLHPRGRTHVHLSTDQSTARAVGARHGSPVVLRVDTAGMLSAGHAFYQAGNGVWLTPDVVPPAFLTVAEDPSQ